MTQSITQRPPTEASRNSGWRSVAVVLDLVALVLFVALGKRSHANYAGIVPFLRTLAPFVLGWFAVAWAMHLYRDPLNWGRFAVTWAIGMPAGLVLRALVEWRTPFTLLAILAPLTIGLFMAVWRLVAAIVVRFSPRAEAAVRPAER